MDEDKKPPLTPYGSPGTNKTNNNRRGSLDWQLEQHFAYEKEMMMMMTGGGRHATISNQRLLQNCDLPPPAKLFSPFVVSGDIDKDGDGKNKNKNDRPESKATPSLNFQKWEYELGPDPKVDDNKKNTSLLRALQFSQTRAREAEKKAANADVTNQQMTVLLLNESLMLSAHQRWVTILEAENAVLKKVDEEGQEPREDDASQAVPAAAAVWWFALALCVGIAGVGFALSKMLM